MKKLFSKIETKIDPSQKESKSGQSLVGKVFQVGKQHSVTVEDIIAEGIHSPQHICLNSPLNTCWQVALQSCFL